jgi:hypothetical protein
MARRAEESPVSFFSFQDVLMALIGIVVLITVMMLLVAITRTAGAVAVAVDSSSVTTKVELAKLEQRRDALIELISRASQPAADSGSRRASVALEIRLGQSEVDQLKDELEAIQRNIRDLINRHHNAAAAGMLQAREDVRAKLEAELERETQRRQVTYIVGGDVKEVPVGIELSGDKGVVFLLQRTGEAQAIGHGTSLEGVIEYAKSLAHGSPSGFYLLFIIKPSGVEWWSRLEAEYYAMPGAARPKIGIDLVREGGHCVGLFPAGGKDRP